MQNETYNGKQSLKSFREWLGSLSFSEENPIEIILKREIWQSIEKELKQEVPNFNKENITKWDGINIHLI